MFRPLFITAVIFSAAVAISSMTTTSDTKKDTVTESNKSIVRLSVDLSSEGEVVNVKVIESNPSKSLHGEAIRMAMNKKYETPIVNGVPQEVKGKVLEFEFDDTTGE